MTVLLFLSLPAAANQFDQNKCVDRAQLAAISEARGAIRDQNSSRQCKGADCDHACFLASRYAGNSNTLIVDPFLTSSNDRWAPSNTNEQFDIYFSGIGILNSAANLDAFPSDANILFNPQRAGQKNSMPFLSQSSTNFIFAIARLDNVESRQDGPGRNGISRSSTPQNLMPLNDENHSKGPDPFYDIVSYGARSLPYASTPLVTTCKISSGSSIMTLGMNNGNQILNGDSVRCDGAGPVTRLVTPTGLTVAPYVNAGGSTSAPFTGPSEGATKYSYKIIACDKQGGCTAATAPASTANGQSKLGRVTATTSSMNLSNQVLTVNTISAHGLSPHELVYIVYFSSSTPLFEGWYTVASTPNETQFTVTTNIDSRVPGTPTSDTSSATVVGFNSIHLQWTPVMNAWKYYIYGRSGGSYKLIGVSIPGQNWWEDYGSPMMDNFAYPSDVPITAPNSKTNDYLLAKVTAGGGTTTLTVTPKASNTVTGAVARMGSDAGILAAMSAAARATVGGGTVRIPAGVYWTAGYLAVPRIGPNYRVEQLGFLNIYDTIQMSSATPWYGISAGSSPSFGWESLPIINGQGAFPIIYYPQGSNYHLDHLNIMNSANNGGLVLLGDIVTNFTADSLSLTDGNATNSNYMGQLAIFRGDFSFRFHNSTFIGGQAPNNTETQIGYTFLPAFVFRPRIDGTSTGGGNFKFEQDWFVGRTGIEQNWSPGRPGDPAPDGINWIILKDIQTQNLSIPLLSLTSYPAANVGGGNIYLENITPADFPNPIVAGLYVGCATNIYENQVSLVQGSRNIFSGCVNGVTAIENGSTQGINREAILNPGAGTYSGHPTYGNYNGQQLQMRQNLDMSAGHGITFAPAAVRAPRIADTGPGGSMSAGTYTYSIGIVGPDGGVTIPGPTSEAITIAANHNITVSWSDVAGATRYVVYRNGLAAGTTCGGLTGIAAKTCTDSGGTTGTYGAQTYSSTGFPSLYPGLITTQKLAFSSVTAGNYGTSTLSGHFTADRKITIPDATFTMSQLVGVGTSTLSSNTIPATTCASAVTTSATGVTEADVISYSFNGPPSGAYMNGLIIESYVTPGRVNFLVCNPTGGSLTPPSATLNWRVTR